MTLKKMAVAALAAMATSFQLMAVNLNTAGIEELQSIKGIGAATAKKIVEYRQEHKFRSIDEVKNVKGIGEKKFARIKKDLEV